MSNDLSLAFGHPEMRAAATSSDEPHDRISLRDHIVETEIGAFQEERGKRQRLCFNIVVEVQPLVAPFDDDVDRILSYDTITDSIKFELNFERINLLETLAARVADRILTKPQALRTFIRIEKLDRGPGALGVEIVRSRAQLPTRLGGGLNLRRPMVVFLGPNAIQSQNLDRWLTELEAMGEPIVLTVGAGDMPIPQSASKAALRRILLLAIEQTSWVLAGRDARCVVVSTRTEIAHAISLGKILVWAPSKIVLDDRSGAALSPDDPVGLAVWFAKELNARRTIVVGADGAAFADQAVTLVDENSASIL
jgi:7,8-dihydroneopterin aldolase/epimerase/oxygenase